EVFLDLAHEHDVDAGMQRLHERVVGDAGTHVGVEAERLASRDVQALEPSALRGRDRSFQENPCSTERLPGRRLDTGARPAPINPLADLDLLDRELRSR